MSSLPVFPVLAIDKALAIGAYGESVAAYRYLILAEKAHNPGHRRRFAEMADEEQDHKQRLERQLAARYPDAQFMLTPQDKEMVVVGPRLIDVRDDERMAESLRLTLATERRTSTFYHHLGEQTEEGPLRRLFRELAEEGADHYHRLQELVRQAGVEPGE